MPPLILTLQIDEKSRAFFNAARTELFPPERNLLDAHLTLFHQLPDDPEIYTQLRKLKQEIFNMQVTGLMNLGAGVAYQIDSQQLQNLHRQLSAIFSEELIPQDRQKFRPHITIMNKTTPEKATQVLAALKQTFRNFEVEAIGLSLWRYLGGPWDHLQDFSFTRADN